MSNSRQRMSDALNYENPDKIPVIFGMCDSGLYIHGEKLMKLLKRYKPDLPFELTEIPQPAPTAFNEKGEYHEKRTDIWGTEYEYLDFGIIGHPSKYPFNSWEEAESYEFPPIPPEENSLKDTAREKEKVEKEKENFLVFRGWISVWERLHALRPMDEVMISLCMNEPPFLNFLERLAEYQTNVIKYYINLGADCIVFGDDWGAQHGPMISPESFKNIFRPIYEKMFDIVHKADCKVIFHSCGNLGYILDELIELGIDCIWPQISFYKIEELTDKLHKHKVAMYIHPDRQKLMPYGSPSEIENTIKNYCNLFKHLKGGGIFNIEIESDIPFENVEALINSVFMYR